MAIVQIPLGQAPYGEDGADAREAFTTVNQNFAELDARSAQNADDIAGKADSNDARFTDAREWIAATVSQAEAEAGIAVTRRAWTAQRVRQAIVAWWNSVSSAWGRGFVSSADAAAGRTALGLGSAATRTALGTTGSLYSMDSILGTVSQAGGVPTGAIIERGSNANGEYVRFADGTQECFIPGFMFVLAATANTEVVGSWTLPAAFVGSSPVVIPAIQNVGSSSAYTVSKLASNTVNLTTADVRLIASVAQNYRIGLIAKGRWY